MKKTVFIVFILLTLLHTGGFGQKKQGNRSVKYDTLSVDSLKYELTIIDPGFETWLATQPPKEFHSQGYYEQKNRLYVSEWNQRYMSSTNRGRVQYESYVDYQPGIDYGLDLNYRLYYYFRYFELTNKIRLIPGRH